MLSHLHIEHFALIEKMDMDFSPKLNILTGETGAGKSIVIDAIRFVLGERLDSIHLSPSDSAILVEASFEISISFARNDEIISGFLEDGDEVLVLKRELQPQGKTRCWINQRLVNASTLKQIGSFLIDIHGQYDHQQLLDPKWQLELLDQYGKNQSEKAAYEKLFGEYLAIQKQIDEINQMQEGRERELDLLKYQINEIERAAIDDLDEEEVARERLKLANAEKLAEISCHLSQILEEDDQSVLTQLSKVQKELSGLVRLDSELQELTTEIENAMLVSEEIARRIRDYQASLPFDSERLLELEKKMDVLDLLKKKYGKTLPEIKQFYRSSKHKYDQLINSEHHSHELDKRIKRIVPVLKEHAQMLSQRRKKAVLELKKSIEGELQDLQMPHAQFECDLAPCEFSSSGMDQGEFRICLNLGQPLLPLREIVSAGEVARMMLAIKKTLAKVDSIPTMIFDEIDANIGGRLGQVTGRKLAEIAAQHQVILITHLPQIAAFADRHFKVSKSIRSSKTQAEYQVLEGDDRVAELAQMMTGVKETEIARKHAQEMLKSSR